MPHPSPSRHVVPSTAPRPRSIAGACGFSLVEVLVATGILAAGLIGVAQLLAVTTAQTLESRHATRAAILAGQVVERLRAGIEWREETGLSSSVSLRADTPGFVDYVDATGTLVAGGPPMPAGAIYTRRWAVHPLPAAPDEAVVLEVLVTAHRVPLPVDAVPGQRPGDARLTTLVRRRGP
jgi:hypothetical protein